MGADVQRKQKDKDDDAAAAVAGGAAKKVIDLDDGVEARAGVRWSSARAEPRVPLFRRPGGRRTPPRGARVEIYP